jgi:organic hydroperoxide reductase OsmC/OhrA
MMTTTHAFSSSLRWTRHSPDFNYNGYDRSHDIVTGSGVSLPATSAPAFLGSATRVNPEELLVAALSSCHMLTLLAIAAKKRFVIDSYSDDAVAFMEPNAAGKLSVTRATLRPKVVFSGDRIPTHDEQTRMHHQAHENCFIANSVATVVVVEPVLVDG